MKYVYNIAPGGQMVNGRTVSPDVTGHLRSKLRVQLPVGHGRGGQSLVNVDLGITSLALLTRDETSECFYNMECCFVQCS